MDQASQRGGERRRLEWTPEEESEFAVLFGIAWSLRGTDGYATALELITEWNADLVWRLAQVALAHRASSDHEIEQLALLLQATDPARFVRRAVA